MVAEMGITLAHSSVNRSEISNGVGMGAEANAAIRPSDSDTLAPWPT
jgi:hypothetical protein